MLIFQRWTPTRQTSVREPKAHIKINSFNFSMICLFVCLFQFFILTVSHYSSGFVFKASLYFPAISISSLQGSVMKNQHYEGLNLGYLLILSGKFHHDCAGKGLTYTVTGSGSKWLRNGKTAIILLIVIPKTHIVAYRRVKKCGHSSYVLPHGPTNAL